MTQSSVEVGREGTKGKTASGHWPEREHPCPPPGGIARVGTNPKDGALRNRASVGGSLHPGMAPVQAGRGTAPWSQLIVEFTGSKRLQSPPTTHSGLGAQPAEGLMCLIPLTIPTLPVVNGRPQMEARDGVCDPSVSH